MKVCSISDIHGNLIPYPSQFWEGLEECEVLFICGDILPTDIQHTMIESEDWLLTKFKPWAENLPVKKVCFIAGNHDFWFERNEVKARIYFQKYAKVAYLKNEGIEYFSETDGKIYTFAGSPYCHMFGNWAFMRYEDTLQTHFNNLPHDVDVLFTHDAPYGTSDICLEGWAADGRHKGCPALRDAVIEKKPKYLFHGHLHSTNHSEELLEDTKVFNTSIVNEEYDIAYPPLMITLCK